MLPGIAAVYLIAAPISLWRRIRDGLIAVGAMLVSAGWWVAIVQLTPAAYRPYVGSSTDNSFLSLTFGYNGLSRILAHSAPTTHAGAALGRASSRHAGGHPGGAVSNFNAGLLRMFAGDFGGHISWLIPAALILGLAGLWIIGPAKRTDVRRAALLLWGATLVVTGLTFSLMSGMAHEYYTVALAPSIGALVGIGGWLVWTRRVERWALPVLAAVSLVTTGWAFVILARTPQWLPWLRWAVLAVGVLGSVGLVLGRRLGVTVLRAGVALALVAALAGPTAWTVQTVLTPHQGGGVKTGPSSVHGTSGRPSGPGGRAWFSGANATRPRGQAGTVLNGRPAGPTTASDAVITLLLNNATAYTWVAATGSETAATYQLLTGQSVMPIGGFSGGDPSPTLQQFQAYVADGKIHYYIVGRSGSGGRGGKQVFASIETWVRRTFTAQTVDGVTLYDLTKTTD